MMTRGPPGAATMPGSTPASTGQWKAFLHRCLLHRIDTGEFKELSKMLFARSPIGEAPLLDALLDSRLSASASATGKGAIVKWDPLVPIYIDVLIKMGKVSIAAVLGCLLKHSFVSGPSSRKNREKEKDTNNSIKDDDKTAKTKKKRPVYTLMTDIRVVQDAMLSVSTGQAAKTALEAVHAFSAIVDWIQALIAWHNGQLDAEMPAGMLGNPDAVLLFESVGILLAALSGTGKGLTVLSRGGHESLKIRLGQAISAYLPMCDEVSPPLRNRLDGLQKEFHLYGQPPSKLDVGLMGDVNALQFEASVIDGPTINSRAGLYVYLNAMLVGRPLVDDSILLNYLLNRYAGHYEVLIEEIITAAFDVLSNAVYRNESGRTMLLLRSFLVNKLPPFFSTMLSVSMVSLSMEVCLSHALSRIDPNTFPSFSQMFSMQGNTALSDVRQEFLFSCASHKLIPESSIERLLGENPMQTLPTGGSFVKDDLVAQINANHERAEQLISDIESTEGNAGAIVGAITEVMHTLAIQKETMTLKNICNSLSRRPQSLDVMLLFRSPKQILQPLVQLIDAWHWDEDQGESQPVYDEFGSILLLILAFKYRYDLRPFDLGVTSGNSFLVKLLERGSSSQKLDELSGKQNKNIEDWIAALFIAEGISEETMSSCSPQEFYMLVSTLFAQSLGACEAGKLEFDTLKGGFEYLLEPFLLPSLIVALTWLGNHIWEAESDPTVPLKTLQSLVKPTSISGEAREIHLTVLNITARSLEEQLKDVRARHPQRTDIKPILDTLEPCLSFQRTGAVHKSELEPWTTYSPGGLLGSIRSTFQSLILWSTSADASVSVSIAPPSYTHRQIITAIRVLGSVRVLGAILDELKLQNETGTGTGTPDVALDIAAALVSAPLAESYTVDQAAHHPPDQKDPPPRTAVLTLRDALNLLHENVPKLSEKDPLRAEIVVRLYRRVNILLTPPPQAQVDINMDVNMNMNVDMNNIMGDMHLDIPQGAGDQGPSNQNMGLDNQQADDDQANLNQIMDNAAAAVGMDMDINMDGSGGMGSGMGVGDQGLGGLGLGEGDQSIDDVLNAAEMNPEFLDLDMEGMF
ncbi:putative RNA polymerase II mediator complex subunit Nut1 [Aspergillus stella-maris]|uniref:putative RNA polymerase II mediator complex subunit Nut1 n=1 Tax=Aspergillus stella-maris TaxID=1810926 RepID=UPI003CCDB937